ncbi:MULTISPECIES: glycosyltransferase family 4 protein [Stenotrophomonas]|uniref:glycosyltransferase family 4 protein n=1 Tax=Stenotrophomonas TaxID=40323 RepID=UPI000770552B|nr:MULTISPECIES: glycosyltransferase family 4 protein [Stenotrophomonas]AMJ57779.1 hypothetical protein AXG53_14930 [Stenotrophomonas sp. KCTC 12332]
MMSRTFFSRTYHLIDRQLISRLPAFLQRAVLSTILGLAKRMRPSANWPSSVDALMVRRALREPEKIMRVLPDWAVRDMHDLSIQVDSLLAPGPFQAKHPRALYAPTHWTSAGKAYQRILEKVGDRQFETVLLVPWLRRGGADLGALHHARLCDQDFGQRTLVIATEGGSSPWAERLPEGVLFVDAGRELTNLSTTLHEPEIVLSRLLIQLAPRRLHIINSHVAWHTVERFGLALRQKTRIFASLYCDEITEDGRADGLAQRYLPSTAHRLDAVITDNSASPHVWCRTLGTRSDLFKVVHFPAPEAPVILNANSPRKRILWASRLERQKRPELLVEIATKLQDYHWDVYGVSLAGTDPHLAALARLENVTLHGAFDRFHEIVSPEHLAYVYTTAWDGLPNVLLEAAQAGLPIVAPDVGGIRDLIPIEWLLSPRAGAAEYAVDIVNLTDVTLRKQRVTAQTKRLESFTWEHFANGMREISGYNEEH